LWRRPRPKLGCGAKEKKKKKELNMAAILFTNLASQHKL
jgi:hypothetical protein